MNRSLLACLLLLGLATPARAQSRVSTAAAQFLTIGTGARGSALGHAYTAAAGGADALFWNPGGAAFGYDGTRGSVLFTHYEWLVDIDYNALGIVIPVTGAGVLGLSLGSVDYGRMEVRTVEIQEGTGETFAATDLSAGVSYAQPLTESFYIGGTLKYVQQRIRDMTARTAAFDIGFVLQTQYLQGLRLAASIMNFGGKMRMSGVNAQVFVDPDPANQGNNPNIPARLDTDAWDLPLSFRFGFLLPVARFGNLSLEALADANQTNDNNLNSDLGGQLRYATRALNFELRAGYRDLMLDNVDSHLSYGAGLDLRVQSLRVGFDYAFVPQRYLNSMQMLDLRVYF